jgi:hypothetical protein
MTSGRSLPRKGADKSRASGRYKETVRTMMTARVRTLSGLIRTCGLHLRPDTKGEPFGPPVRPDVNVDRPDAPHCNTRKAEENLQR